jgi:hypothetical protein
VDEAWYELNFGTSRFREVAEGASSWERVDIVGGDGQPARIRTLLEEMLVDVRSFPVGQPRHLVNVLGRGLATAPYLVLALHGDDGGLIVPGEPLAGQRQEGRFGPDDVRQFADLEGRNVLSLGCETGTEELGRAFLDAGALAYAAPQGWPFVQTSTLFAILVFRELALRRGTFSEAVGRAAQYDDETALWQVLEA